MRLGRWLRDALQESLADLALFPNVNLAILRWAHPVKKKSSSKIFGSKQSAKSLPQTWRMIH